MTDISLNANAMYGSITWAALRIGRSKDWFFRAREKLEAEGFPCRDPLTNMYLKQDVDAWIEKRRRIAQAANLNTSTPAEEPQYGKL